MFRRKQPADPFATFSERYGKRLREPHTEPPEDAQEPPREDPTPRPSSWAHAALGVHPGASQKEISAAYRRLARLHHPDVAGDEERMKVINAAYRELRR